MTPMTSHERVKRMYEHREADRIPVTDGPWTGTIERWHREGMPEGVSYEDYFDLDHWGHISADNSPRFGDTVIEETDEYIIRRDNWGATFKLLKGHDTTPEYLDFIIKDRASWEMAKKRMQPDRDRVDWAALKRDYPVWRKKGYWVEAGFWFGFDVTHARTVGTERLLMALADDPDWCVDMFNHFLNVHIALHQMIWDAGYHADSMGWPDDMGYKHRPFFSIGMYRELLKPAHQRAIDWGHAHDMKTHLHSCGNIMTILPDLVAMGLDGLNPLEVKAGMDPIAIKRQYGDKLLLHGGINCALWDKPAAFEAEMRRILPVVKQRGGYIFSSDHSVPNSVSLENFRHVVQLAKELGAY